MNVKNTNLINKELGMMLPIYSLPSDFGHGTMGKYAYEFVDYLAENSFSIWQILPIQDQIRFDISPYSICSGFAGNYFYIDLETLYKDGLICKKNDILKYSKMSKEIYYRYLDNELLIQAASRFLCSPDSEFENFCKKNDYWLESYSVFTCLKKEFNYKPWCEWPKEYQILDNNSISKFKIKHSQDILMVKVLQYLFYQQYFKLKTYANKKGIKIFGDMPFFLDQDSCDAWCDNYKIFIKEAQNQDLYIHKSLNDEEIFCYGGLLINWDKLEKTNFKWLQDRLEYNFKLFDIVRLDHFVGYKNYYSAKKSDIERINKYIANTENVTINASMINHKIKTYNTHFEKIYENVFAKYKKRLVAESDVDMTQTIKEKNMFFTGNFSFENYKKLSKTNNRCFAYISTHDTKTAYDEYESLSIDKQRDVNYELKVNNGHEAVDKLINLSLKSTASSVILLPQDLLHIGPEGRHNTPGIPKGQWTWQLSLSQFNKLRQKSIKLL